MAKIDRKIGKSRAEGPTEYWWASPRGQTSALTLANGTCFGVDFTGASGADVMLVTTGKAKGQTVKLSGKTLTFYFPTVDRGPDVRTDGNAAVIGRQRVTIEDGNLLFRMRGE